MKKKTRIIALAVAFCIVFAISASAIQVDAIHAYNYFAPHTDISCHGYLNASNSNNSVNAWASTELSHAVDNIIRLYVLCIHEGPNGVPYGSNDKAKGPSNSIVAVSLYDTPVVGPVAYSYLTGYHEVEFEDPATGAGGIWSGSTYGTY